MMRCVYKRINGWQTSRKLYAKLTTKYLEMCLDVVACMYGEVSMCGCMVPDHVRLSPQVVVVYYSAFV